MPLYRLQQRHCQSTNPKHWGFSNVAMHQSQLAKIQIAPKDSVGLDWGKEFVFLTSSQRLLVPLVWDHPFLKIVPIDIFEELVMQHGCIMAYVFMLQDHAASWGRPFFLFRV